MKSDIKLPAFQVARDTSKVSATDADLLPTLTALGLERKNFKVIGRKGDLAVILTEVTLEGHRPQPAMVLANHRDPRNRHVYIPMNDLWRYLEPDAMRNVAPQLAAHLYGVVTRDDTYRVLDAIYEFAEDLLRAPPAMRASTADWIGALERDGMTITHHVGRD